MKKILYNIFSVLFLLLVHALLCAVYCVTYYNGVTDGYSGFKHYALLIVFFLASPLLYYISGRLFSKKANKKFYVITTWVIFGAIAVFAVVALYFPQYLKAYSIINAPSYMYYLLFADSVRYIAVPAMAISAVFPALFSRMGIYKKPRTHNEIKTEDIKKDEKQSSD